jgi:hypothetical protein
MPPTPKRRKIECLLCEKTFDSDYRSRHNNKYHSDKVKKHQHIPYEYAGAPANPFQVNLYNYSNSLINLCQRYTEAYRKQKRLLRDKLNMQKYPKMYKNIFIRK